MYNVRICNWKISDISENNATNAQKTNSLEKIYFNKKLVEVHLVYIMYLIIFIFKKLFLSLSYNFTLQYGRSTVLGFSDTLDRCGQMRNLSLKLFSTTLNSVFCDFSWLEGTFSLS